MPIEIPAFDSASLALNAYSRYCSLVQACGSACTADQGLGGKLLYAGELDRDGRSITIAGNVAGCSTLAATADLDAQKQAIRDGVVDFSVTSLDEALRILKNEIRKHSTVAVCVGKSTDEIEREMLERGVQPDLSRQHANADLLFGKAQGAPRSNADPEQSPAAVVWSVESLPSKWLPRFDAIALECLSPSDGWNRRWIHRLPGYIGRAGANLRVIRSDREFATSFVEHVRSAFEHQAIGTAATIWVESEAGPEIHNLQPASQASV